MRIAPVSTLAVAVVVLITLSSCGQSDQSGSHYYELLALPANLDREIPQRIWPEMSIRQLFEVPLEPEVSLWDPGAVIADTQGFIYVVDFSNLNVLRFDRNGSYMTTYGLGLGRGPGEFMSIMDFGVIGDSVLYVNDLYARRITYFEMDGSIIGTESLTRRVDAFQYRGALRHSVTSRGRTYTMYQAGEFMFESRLGDEVTAFGPHLGGKSIKPSAIVMGMMTTWGEQLVFAPVNFPVIIKYNPGGTLAFARPTPDFGQVELPSLEREVVGGSVMTRLEGGRIHGTVSAHDDEIFVRVPNHTKPCIDVYDANSGMYKYSFETPTASIGYVLYDRLYEVQDSTVKVWEIDKHSVTPIQDDQ